MVDRNFNKSFDICLTVNETDKLLLGGIYQIIFMEYPIVFLIKDNNNHNS